MDYPSVSRPAARPQLPSINIVKGPPMAFDPQSPGMPRSPNYMSPSSEFPTPIMIQGKEDDYHQAPPPLPPPKLPFDDPLPHEYRGPRYGSSSAGSRVGSIGDERPHYAQRGLHRDEGYESFGSNNRYVRLGQVPAAPRPRGGVVCCDRTLETSQTPGSVTDSATHAGHFRASARSTTTFGLAPTITATSL